MIGRAPSERALPPIADTAVHVDIAIIGGGFSGAALAIHLARGATSRLRITIFEPRAQVGRGVAYAAEPWHRLNVRAAAMSIVPGQANDFLDWATARLPGITAGSFAPRVRYGEYVADTFAASVEDTRADVVTHRARISGVQPMAGGWCITTESGAEFAASIVVLATGNGRPAHPACVPSEARGHPRYVPDPWAADALTPFAPDEPVLVLGTGLTMADVVVSLRERGHCGFILALSRRGLLPATHLLTTPSTPLPRDLDAESWTVAAHEGIAALTRRIRLDVRANALAGVPWHLVVDQVRFAVPTLWAALAPAERARFLRHLRPWWDTHRHRLPPEVAARLVDDARRQTLAIQSGRVLTCAFGKEVVEVSICRRGALAPEPHQFGRVINATGTESRPDRDPVLAPLIAAGQLRADALGLPTNPDRHALDGRGEPVHALYVLGPALRSTYWEATAVPELARHAAALAEHILATRS